MAIAFDSVGTGASDGAAATISWTHTISSNSNGILIALPGARGSENYTSLVYQGNSLTKVIAGTNSTTNELELWYLLNPPTGLGTFQGTVSKAASSERIGLSMAFTGVDQTIPIKGSAGSVTSTAASGSVILAMAGTNSWMVGGCNFSSKPGTTDTTGNNTQQGSAPASFNEIIGNTIGTIAAANSGTMRWTNPATSSHVMVAAELNPFVQISTGESNISKRTLMGVGN